MDELDAWLSESYQTAYRSACLILGSHADAEDAVQEAFLRVWRFRGAIPPGEGRRRWLYRVVVNVCLTRLRSAEHRHTRAVGPDDLIRLSQSRAPSPRTTDVQVEESVRAEDVVVALTRLPETLRVPVVLRYYAGLSEREIATAIRRRPGTVKSRLFEARKRLAADPGLRAWADDVEEVAR